MTTIKNIIFLLIISFGLRAQTDSLLIGKITANDLKKIGKNALLQNDPNTAVSCFEQFLKYEKNNHAVQYLLGEAYRRTRNYEGAEKMYAQAYKGDSKKYPEALYYQGEMLKAMTQYDKAKECFTKFKKEYHGKDRIIKKLDAREIEYCDSAKRMMLAEKKIMVEILPPDINKLNAEASPLSLDKNTMVFSSLRTDKKEFIIEDDTNNVLVRKLYVAKRDSGDWKFDKEWDQPFNKPGYNTGNVTITPDGKKMYFTRCKPNLLGKMTCAIYVSESKNNKWSEPVKLDKKINNPKYNNSHPSVSIDPVKKNEMVYFASDRKGGRGKMDIWYFVYDVKKKIYKEPKNAGNKINTTEDEMTPYFDNETRTLYFSSDGLGGMGGLDVFKAVGDGKKWLGEENMGSPVNSGADDIYYTISKNREEGFLVSNRKNDSLGKKSTCCDDIYMYKYSQYIHLNIKGNIYEVTNGTNKSIDSSIVELYVKKGGENFLVKSLVSDPKGNYDMLIEAGNDYTIIVKKDNYLSGSTSFSTKHLTGSQTLEKDIPLTGVPREAMRIPNVLYEFDKSDITAPSKLALDTTIFFLMQANPSVIIEISSHTDNKGNDSYNNKLSQKRAESVVNYLIAKGISAERLHAKGYGKTHPIVPNENSDGSDNPEGRAQNRRTDFKIIGKLNVEIINNGKDE